MYKTRKWGGGTGTNRSFSLNLLLLLPYSSADLAPNPLDMNLSSSNEKLGRERPNVSRSSEQQPIEPIVTVATRPRSKTDPQKPLIALPIAPPLSVASAADQPVVPRRHSPVLCICTARNTSPTAVSQLVYQPRTVPSPSASLSPTDQHGWESLKSSSNLPTVNVPTNADVGTTTMGPSSIGSRTIVGTDAHRPQAKQTQAMLQQAKKLAVGNNSMLSDPPLSPTESGTTQRRIGTALCSVEVTRPRRASPSNILASSPSRTPPIGGVANRNIAAFHPFKKRAQIDHQSASSVSKFLSPLMEHSVDCTNGGMEQQQQTEGEAEIEMSNENAVMEQYVQQRNSEIGRLTRTNTTAVPGGRGGEDAVVAAGDEDCALCRSLDCEIIFALLFTLIVGGILLIILVFWLRGVLQYEEDHFSLPVFPREANAADSSAARFASSADENAENDDDAFGNYEKVPSSSRHPFVTATAAAEEADEEERKGEREKVVRYQSLPENIQCIYTFVAQPRERVKLSIEQFQLEGTTNHCESEYVDMYSELDSPTEDLLMSSNSAARYCGTVAPNVQISLHNVIILVFHSRVGAQRTAPFALGGIFEFISEAPFVPGPPLPGGPKGCAFLVEPNETQNDATGTFGNILSPTYPGVYPNNLQCLYLLRGPPNHRIRLFFRDFDVYFGGEHCPYDSLTIYDGASTSDPIIRKLCGLQQRLELFSFGPELLLEFNTTEVEGKVGDRGFHIEYQFSSKFVDIRRLIGAKPSIHCPGHLRGSECDVRVCSNHESVHYVHSPNFPDLYPPNTTCTYILDGLQGDQNLEKVIVRFESFVVPGQSAPSVVGGSGAIPPSAELSQQHQLEPTTVWSNLFPQKCSTSGSFVAIGTTPGTTKAMLANAEESAYDAILCDRIAEGTLKFISQGPRIVLVFDSGEENPPLAKLGSPPYGFRARVEFKTDFGISGESIGGSNRCAFRFRDSVGSFNSPRYPSNYPLDAECTYHIVGPSDAQILLYFKQFALFEENSMDECNDWLEIFDVFRGSNGGETLKLQAKHCWHVFPGPTVSARGSHEMRVVFHSDNFGTANGFDARYEIRPAATKKVLDTKDCKEGRPSTTTIEANDERTTGHFASPGFPVKYTKNLTCDLEIRVREGHQVLLKANMFNVEGQMTDEKVDCMSAVLRVHLGRNNRSGSDLQLCGESVSLIPAIVSSSNSIRLSFLTSPEKVNGLNGFNFSWTEVRRVISDSECSNSERHYLCSYSRLCIDGKLRCNGEDNCGENDDSDEAHCSRIEALASPTTIVVAYIVSGIIFFFILSLFCFLFKSKLERKNYKKAEEKRKRMEKEKRKKAKKRRRDGRKSWRMTTGDDEQSHQHKVRQPYRQPRPRRTVSDGHKLSGIYGGVGGTPFVTVVNRRETMERMEEEAQGDEAEQQQGQGESRGVQCAQLHHNHSHQHISQTSSNSMIEQNDDQNEMEAQKERAKGNNVRIFYG